MIIVVGSGVAGCAAVLAAVRAGTPVTLVTAGPLEHGAAGNSPLAQGGVAAAIGAQDRAADHLADTLSAGAGLTDPAAAELLVRAGADAVRALLADGFAADRDAEGRVALGLEGAHGRARIIHAGGDRTGAVLHAHLASRVRAAVDAGRVVLLERSEVGSLVLRDGAVRGVVLRDAGAGSARGRGRVPATPGDAGSVLLGDAVVLATGGYASLYPVSSNHTDARGQGLLLAARAGALLADLEFVQFHPTVFAPSRAVPRAVDDRDSDTDAAMESSATGSSVTGGARSLLISEAVRGAGAVLRDASGRRFMLGTHPAAELAPRDVVALEMHRVLRDREGESVWLDASDIERREGTGALARRFPSLTRELLARGWDWRREAIPVAPAAHYTMGGVASDLDGRSSVPGLFVAGEIASTGVHGANRLASNSLLEGLVFGERAGTAAACFRPELDPWALRGAGMRALARSAAAVEIPASHGASAGVARGSVASALSQHLGIERDAQGIARAREAAVAALGHPEERDAAELSIAIACAAEARSESRGAHRRSDFPDLAPGAPARTALRLRSGAAAGAEPSAVTLSTSAVAASAVVPSAASHDASARSRHQTAHEHRSVPAC